MIAQATQLLSDNNATKKLTTAVLELLETYGKTSNRDTKQRDKNITLDGVDYRWCNRHEIYEPTTNFKQKDSCRLAVKLWSHYGTELKKLTNRLDVEIDMDELDTVVIKGLNEDIKTLKENRGGRYDFESNQLQFPDVTEYNYDNSMFYTDDQLENK